MTEQTVVKHDGRRERALRKTLRIIQIILFVLTGIGLIFGFTIASVFWDTDRTVFWQAAMSMLFLSFPVAAAAMLLEWRIRKLGVEFDYVLSDQVLTIFRISGNRRSLWITLSVPQITFCKRYDELEEADKPLLAHAYFACCNASDPRLTLLAAESARIGKKDRVSPTILLEPNEDLFTALSRAARRHRV